MGNHWTEINLDHIIILVKLISGRLNCLLVVLKALDSLLRVGSKGPSLCWRLTIPVGQPIRLMVGDVLNLGAMILVVLVQFYSIASHELDHVFYDLPHPG